jgi:hypothetical protein
MANWDKGDEVVAKTNVGSGIFGSNVPVSTKARSSKRAVAC